MSHEKLDTHSPEFDPWMLLKYLCFAEDNLEEVGTILSSPSVFKSCMDKGLKKVYAGPWLDLALAGNLLKNLVDKNYVVGYSSVSKTLVISDEEGNVVLSETTEHPAARLYAPYTGMFDNPCHEVPVHIPNGQPYTSPGTGIYTSPNSAPFSPGTLTTGNKTCSSGTTMQTGDLDSDSLITLTGLDTGDTSPTGLPPNPYLSPFARRIYEHLCLPGFKGQTLVPDGH